MNAQKNDQFLDWLRDNGFHAEEDRRKCEWTVTRDGKGLFTYHQRPLDEIPDLLVWAMLALQERGANPYLTMVCTEDQFLEERTEWNCICHTRGRTGGDETWHGKAPSMTRAAIEALVAFPDELPPVPREAVQEAWKARAARFETALCKVHGLIKDNQQAYKIVQDALFPPVGSGA